jgi:hypothetical protein
MAELARNHPLKLVAVEQFDAPYVTTIAALSYVSSPNRESVRALPFQQINGQRYG